VVENPLLRPFAFRLASVPYLRQRYRVPCPLPPHSATRPYTFFCDPPTP
jgi:hypothetical protein